MGNSGTNPKPATDCCFVADGVDDGLDVPYLISPSDSVVSVFLPVTRVVGSVDGLGFFDADREGALHLEQGTLARTLTLTIQARIDAVDAGGILGVDGLVVEVVLHRGMEGHEVHLESLEGNFGSGSGWQLFTLDVPVLAVRFPVDPCPGPVPVAACGLEPDPVRNEISFVFTGDVIQPGVDLTFEVDWMTLEPKDQPGLAWRPILLVHGWRFGSSEIWGFPGQEPGAWSRALAARDVGFGAVELNPVGTIAENAPGITAAVADLKKRFGVQRVNIVGYCKGGLDARQHVHRHDDVDTLVMLATPNLGSFMADFFSPDTVVFPREDPKETARSFLEMTKRKVSKYNDRCPRNFATTYVAVPVAHDSAAAGAWTLRVGSNDEWVSLFSVEALGYSSTDVFSTSVQDPENHACVEDFNMGAHYCLVTYTAIVDMLFQFELRQLTGPEPPSGSANGTAGPAREDGAGGPADGEAAAVVQYLGSGTAPIPADGATQAPTVLVDAADVALFYVFVYDNLLSLELVSPAGRRIDAQTPLTDPAVVHAPMLDSGLFFATGYIIQAPETGSWTLELTGTGTPLPGAACATAALVQPPAGTGVVLAATTDRDQGAAGDPVTITATLTAGGLPLTGATVRAEVFHPDGDTTTELILAGDSTGGDAAAGDGVYAGVFTDTALTGDYDVVVSARGAAPAFTREQQLVFTAAPSATAFSGTFSDHGLDTDADGRFDQLVVDVGVQVDVEAVYRVFATLSDGAGTAIEQLRIEQQLEPGQQAVPLAFDGARLSAFGHDGSYLVEDLVIEDVATGTGLAAGPAYTTAAYAHSDFQRPLLLLTGTASDHGAHTPNMERMPYEELVVEVEVDTAVAAEVDTTAKLYAADGTFVAAASTSSSLEPGLGMVTFQFTASRIFRAGQPGPYTLQLFNLQGTAADGTPVQLQAPEVVAVTQPYELQDFAPSPRFTVGGTVTGLTGTGQLELEISAAAPPDQPATFRLRPRNGTFTFSFPRLVSGNPYQVRVTQQPTSPAQTCTITNADGTIEDANITNVTVQCV
jgi:Alpha/beta hydrolase of unknown function (DUF915)